MTENNYSYVIEYGNTNFYKNGEYITSSEVLNELQVKDMVINQFSEENKELQERNNRQAETIRELYNLIENKDWETLTVHIGELKKAEEQLQSEWQTYGG